MAHRKDTVRGARQPATSHHQRNYIHKHGSLSCRVPFDPLLSLIRASLNICSRSSHFSISLEIPRPDSETRLSASLIFPKQRYIIDKQQRAIQCYSIEELCKQHRGRGWDVSRDLIHRLQVWLGFLSETMEIADINQLTARHC